MNVQECVVHSWQTKCYRRGTCSCDPWCVVQKVAGTGKQTCPGVVLLGAVPWLSSCSASVAASPCACWAPHHCPAYVSLGALCVGDAALGLALLRQSCLHTYRWWMIIGYSVVWCEYNMCLKSHQNKQAMLPTHHLQLLQNLGKLFEDFWKKRLPKI